MGDGVGISDTLGRLVGIVDGVSLGANDSMMVGGVDGMLLGAEDSVIDGFDEGVAEGSDEDETEGSDDGVAEGSSLAVILGTVLGAEDSVIVGIDEGVAEGCDDAETEGSDDGVAEGSSLTVILGTIEGCSEGTGELGDVDGLKEGVADGLELTVTVGNAVGVEDGLAETVGKADSALDGASVTADADSCPHFPHVFGHAASPLERTPSSTEQYRAILVARFLIQLHFFFFFLPVADEPTSALESLQVLSSYVQGLVHVTGQTTAASGVRYSLSTNPPAFPQ